MTTTRRTLTADELERITTAGRADWTAAIVETFRCFGIDLADPEGPRVRPSDYAIPSEQWSIIGQACAAGPDPLRGVNHLLDWMNYGPSGFEPEQVAS